MISAKIVAHATRDSPSTLIEITSSSSTSRLLFGHFAEGAQRAILSNGSGVKLSCTKNIFLTGNISYETVGGVASLLIAMGESSAGKNNEICVCGTKGTRVAMTRLRSVEFRQRATTVVDDISQNVSAAGVIVQPVEILPINNHDDLEEEDEQVSQILKNMYMSSSEDGFDPSPTSPTFLKTGTRAMSYLIHSQSPPPVFDAAEAIRLGVPPGKAFAQLKKGEPYKILSTDFIVTSDMVMREINAPGSIAIIDVPHASYIPDIETKMRDCGATLAIYIFRMDINSTEIERLIRIVSASQNIVCHPRFGERVVALPRLQKLNAKLCMLAPECFVKYAEYGDLSDAGFKGSVRGLVGTTSEIRGIECLIRSAEGGKSSEECSLEFNQEAKHEMDDDDDDVEVACIGTGSFMPSAYKNVSSTLIISRQGNILLDCGEASLYGILRICKFNRQEFERVIGDISLVFVSHMHADHVLGLVSLIEKRTCFSKRRLCVVGPAPLYTFLHEWSVLSDQVQFFDAENFVNGKKDVYSMEIETIHAIHGTQHSPAYSGIITYSTTLKIAFSGDTRPNPLFASQAYGSAILIHEATFADNLQVGAEGKLHCTVSEAIDISTTSSARYTLFTHISPRYPVIMPLSDMNEENTDTNTTDNIIYGFDGMRVRLRMWEQVSKSQKEWYRVLARGFQNKTPKLRPF
ncbi:beta-lactamase-like protein [Kockiozyma suomiensis]|uniref:beta-lactamase-like protein n=1 Tax=Kockiozyma suomiensis TaxID=1337062 RepID=UPI0033438490